MFITHNKTTINTAYLNVLKATFLWADCDS